MTHHRGSDSDVRPGFPAPSHAPSIPGLLPDPVAQTSSHLAETDPPRLLFLDDDPQRAEIFLVAKPYAIWVQTAQDCIARLEEAWFEVHLDHDLGGERFVDMNREDCGMEVVRWLCREPRTHLQGTRFVVHTHNTGAALMMVLKMRETGYQAEFIPFGFELAQLGGDLDAETDDVPAYGPSQWQGGPAYCRSRLGRLRAFLIGIWRRARRSCDPS